MDLRKRLEALDAEAAKHHLIEFLTLYSAPAFGALPKREIDIVLFELLRETGAIDREASIFDLTRDLRVTRSKAQTLLYETQIRVQHRSDEELDRDIRALLGKAKFSRDGQYFVLEVEDPMLQAYMRERIRKLGHVSDASFNSALIRLSLDAVTDLALALYVGGDFEEVRQALIAAGAPDDSARGVLKEALRTLAGKVAGVAGEKVAETIGGDVADFLEPVFSGAASQVKSLWNGILG